MKLLVSSSEHSDDKFIQWLIGILRIRLSTLIDFRRLKRLENYYNEEIAPEQEGSSEINLSQICVYILNNFVYFKTKQYYYITINNKKFLPGTHLSLYDIAMYINYGNQDVPGYPIFTDVFNDIMSNIEDYYRWYARERGAV